LWNTERITEVIKVISVNPSLSERILYSMYLSEENIALYHNFIEHDIKKMKQSMYRGAKCAHLDMDFHNNNLLGMGLLLNTLVSDHKGIIEHFAELTYDTAPARLSYAENIENGSATWLYILQCLIKEDWQEYKRAMEIMQNKGVKRMSKSIFTDIAFVEGLFNRDKQKMEEALKVIVSPRNQSYVRRSGDFVTQFISYNAVCYAKLAWLKGIEVEVDSPLVPNDWLPIAPLKDEEYIDYDFIKAYLS
jgi:Immunity protein 49